jgi:stalled ribosome alternative rescue factor ArfA
VTASKCADGRRAGRVKRPNPIARVLRGPAFRARKQRNRRKYTRKIKHGRAPASDET